MANERVFTARDGAVFVQASPTSDVEYAGCMDVDDVEFAEGGIGLIQAFNIRGDGFDVKGHTIEAPEPIELTLTTWYDEVAHFLNQFTPPFYLHLNKRATGIANAINNFRRAAVLKVVKRSSRTLTGLVMRNEDAESDESFGLVAYPPILDVYKVTPDRQTTAEAQAANDIVFVREALNSDILPHYEPGKIGMVVHDAAGAATANIEYTLNGGSTWATCAADPFAANEHAVSVAYFWLDEKRIRFLVSRGVTDAGNPAEVAYTDFNVATDTAIGAVWTQANVGSTNGQFFFGPKSLFAYDQFNIWGVAGAGYIYKSEDAGVTWTAQEAGVLTADDFYVIRFAPGSKMIGFAVGENNAFAKTLDGGVTWSSVTGPSGVAELLTLDVISQQVLFVGDNVGGFYASYNAGLSWTTLTTKLSTPTGAITAVRAIAFLNEVQGFVLSNTVTPVGTVHMTRDCGRTWIALTTPTNAGLNALDALRSNMVFAVGEPQASTAMILKTA